MHTILYVTLARHHARTSAAARRSVSDTLAADPTFVEEGTDNATCDWFVIGGRASGRLSGAPEETLVTRDPYTTLGQDDDARLVDATLYTTFLHRYAGSVTHAGQRDAFGPFRDLDGDPVSPAFLGTKWLVLVDYHA